jgi:hypothetical protein
MQVWKAIKVAPMLEISYRLESYDDPGLSSTEEGRLGSILRDINHSQGIFSVPSGAQNEFRIRDPGGRELDIRIANAYDVFLVGKPN